jgi:hypothetical protein
LTFVSFGQAKEKDFDQHGHLNEKAFKKSTSYLSPDNFNSITRL